MDNMYSLPDTKLGRGGAIAVVVVVVLNFGAKGPPAAVVVVPRLRSFGDDFSAGRCVAAAAPVVGAGVEYSAALPLRGKGGLDRNNAGCCCVGCV